MECPTGSTVERRECVYGRSCLGEEGSINVTQCAGLYYQPSAGQICNNEKVCAVGITLCNVTKELGWIERVHSRKVSCLSGCISTCWWFGCQRFFSIVKIQKWIGAVTCLGYLQHTQIRLYYIKVKQCNFEMYKKKKKKVWFPLDFTPMLVSHTLSMNQWTLAVWLRLGPPPFVVGSHRMHVTDVGCPLFSGEDSKVVEDGLWMDV